MPDRETTEAIIWLAWYLFAVIVVIYTLLCEYGWDLPYFGGVIAMLGWICYFVCQPDNILIHTKAWLISGIIIAVTILVPAKIQGYLDPSPRK